MKIISLKQLAIWLSGVGLVLSVSAQMLQQPLQVGGEGVSPNLIFTLDDSGSMWWECLPDSLCASKSLALEAIPKTDTVGNRNRLGTVV
ncbi:MAG: hypothetical protein RSD82_13845, partial [Comamonas sp.]